jgi:hypothetical protein
MGSDWPVMAIWRQLRMPGGSRPEVRFPLIETED